MSKILFQFNLAKMKVPFKNPLFDDFKAELSILHSLAEDHPGFIWRYQGEEDDRGYIKPYNDPLIMGNLSAWKDYDSLYDYTFCNEHLEILKKKRKWFKKLPYPHSVLYWSTEDDLGSSNEELLRIAKERILYFNALGETTEAFGFGLHKGIL